MKNNLRNFGIGVIFLVSLILNGHILFNADGNEINWSWLFDTELHPWGIFVTNILFSLSNFAFFFLGIMTLNEKFFKKDSLDKR
jgi:hypothetical protein